ncbi:MAG: ABC transporter permease subunit [Alphaproteobacteria bacterium]|nr:ABC transporter permease subunit [Alphaproteobacteria bacterium]
MKRNILPGALAALAVLGMWEAVVRFGHWGYNVLPTPSAIVILYWQDADLYIAHAAATLETAALGFVFGNIAAILAAVAFCRYPVLEQIFRGVNLTLFVIPMLVVGPILVLVFRGDEPQIILSASAVYYPTMAATLIGLQDIDPRLVDLVQIYGGGERSVMRFVRFRAAVPSLLAGLRVASATSVLGAILGEFGSGTRWGLGTYLLGSLPDGDPARLWGIGIAATAIALAGYGAFAALGRRVVGATKAVTIASKLPDQIAGGVRHGAVQRVLLLVASIAMPFLLWVGLVRGTGLSPIIAPGPFDTLVYLTVGQTASEARATLFAALGATLPAAGLGLLFGLAGAFALASLSILMPRLVKAVIPPALILQSTPLVALAPIILLIFGRDLIASVVIAVIVVFFSAFVVLSQGFELVPRAARELVEVYGGGPTKQLALISVPYAIGYLFAAAKLVAPRALLGVMVAEWLLTGTGLGHLLDVARGDLDYEMVWAGALVSILVAMGAYQAVALIERMVR